MTSPGKKCGTQPESEADHYKVCKECGQAFDMRELSEVFYHDIPGHQPKRLDS